MKAGLAADTALAWVLYVVAMSLSFLDNEFRQPELVAPPTGSVNRAPRIDLWVHGPHPAPEHEGLAI